jgi:hypothetical protein
VLDYGSSALRDAVFADVVNANYPSGPITFCLLWDEGEVEYSIRELGPKEGELVTELSFKTNSDTVSAVLSGEPGKAIYDLAINDTRFSQCLTMRGFRPVVTSDLPAVREVANKINKLLDGLETGIHWLGAVRAPPPRYFEIGPGSKLLVAPDGSGVAQVLRASQRAGDGVSEGVSNWLESACQCELSTAETDGQLVFNRQMFPFRLRSMGGSEASVAVRDVGEGIAQALPVVTLCHQALAGQLGPNPILAFEQPELHLHPAAGVKLAEEVIRCVAKGSPGRHVIETHSESFLLSMQTALVGGQLSPAQITVYWVDQVDGTSSLQPISFDNDGYPVGGWPAGVFRETLDQADRLARLRLGTDAPSTG